MTPRVWTLRHLRALAARRTAGEPTREIAASVGTTANNLRHRWLKHLGFRAHAVHMRQIDTSARTRKVWGLVHAGMRLSDCCRVLDWPVDQRHINRLSMSIRRYCTRMGIPLPGAMRAPTP